MGQLVRFWVESKAFELLPESWRSSLKIVERSRRVWRFVVMGRSGLEWLMATMEAVLQAEKKLDFTKHLREGNRTFMAQRCSNKHGSKKENQKKINLEVNHKDPSTSGVARRSYAAALKTGHDSGVHSEGNDVSGLQITPQNQLVAMHNSLKKMETQLVELKAAIAFLSTKIDLLSAGGNRVVKNKTKIGSNPLSDKGKRKIGFGPVSITRSRRVWRVKKKSGLFEVGSTSGIGIDTSVIECHSPQVTSVLEETMAPSLELKENGVILLEKGSAEVAHKGSPEVKELDVMPLEITNGVVEEVRDLNMDLALVPCLESGVQLDIESGDIVAPLVSLPPIADWILPKVNEIQQFVGISHGGCEDQFKELITAIEASHSLETKSSFKKSRELQRLFSTINYDAKGGSSTKGKTKGRAL